MAGPGSPGGDPADEQRVGMCVITVSAGPDGHRSALVSFRPDLSAGGADERRTRGSSVDEVLTQVRLFLAASGIGR